MDRLYAPALLKEIGVFADRALFVGTLKLPRNDKERDERLKAFAWGLHRLDDDCWDHRDVLGKVPMVIWVLPCSLKVVEPEMRYLGASREYLFFRPFDQWLAYADSFIPEAVKRAAPLFADREASRAQQESMLRHTNRCEIMPELRCIAEGLKGKVRDDGFNSVQVMGYFGLPQEQVQYLLETDFNYCYRPETGDWR